MKKIVLGIATVCGLALSSCNMGGGENYQNVAYYPSNLIIPTDGSDAVMSQGAYSIKFDFNDATATVSSTAIKVNNKDYSFTANPVKYTDYGYKQLMTGISAVVIGNNEDVSNGTFLISSYDAFPKDFNPINRFTPTIKDEKTGKANFLPGTMIAPVVQNVNPLFIGYYQLGNNYTVRTFTTDAFYSGKTNTGLATSDNTVYRVIMDIEKKKAVVVIYDAKFADAMPAIQTIILPELDVVMTNDGYKVVGTNITPLVPEGDALMANLSDCTPNENFAFNSFEMRTKGKYMTSADMSFRVAGRFNGNFSGSYVKLPEGMQ